MSASEPNRSDDKRNDQYGWIDSIAPDLLRASRELVETALAHVVGDKAEQAYRRSDALEKRRKLMDAWAAYCAPREIAPVPKAQAAATP